MRRTIPAFALVMALGAAALTITVTVAGGCASHFGGDGLDVTTLPVAVRSDYELFARRCSKCHSLARPLESGIDDDRFWESYVERMRRQPASGISPQDTVPILRFLHYYSVEQQREKRQRAVGAGAFRSPPA